MSSDNANNQNASPDVARQQRRGSVTSSAAFSSLFRGASTAQGTNFPGPVTAAAMNDQRRRLSITTLGLSGTSPTAATPYMHRASLSTNSDSIDENAVDEDDGARTVPTTPFTRRMSFGAQVKRGMRPGGSPGANGRPSPSPPLCKERPSPPMVKPLAGIGVQVGKARGMTALKASSITYPKTGSDMTSPVRTDQGFNWPEQLRSRAETTVATGPRPSFSMASGLSASPPRAGASFQASNPHNRAKSISDMPAPPADVPKPRQLQKPDPIQERILKGDFYMD